MAEQTTRAGDSQGTGTDTLQTTGNSKLDARKAIFARAAAGTAADISIDREQHQDVDAATEAIERGEISEMGEDVRTVSEDSVLRRQSARSRGEEDTESETADAVAGAGDVDLSGENVVTDTGGDDPIITMKVFGRDIQMPKSEVDARGGPAVVQMLLAADHRFRQATALANSAREADTAAKARLAEAERLERKMRDASAAGGTPSGQQQTTTTNGQPADADLRATVKSLVGEMFKGDAEGIEKALTEVLAARPQRGAPPSVEDVTALVLAKVEAKLFRDRADERAAQAKTAEAQETQDVNSLMRTKYAAVNGDPELQAMARGLFQKAQSDPRNKGRSLVAIADDVGASMMKRFGLEGAAAEAAGEEGTVNREVQTRRHMKRRLPQQSTVSERSSSAEAEETFPTKPSDIVNMMRVARGQPPM
jgi:hypothetical protein